jgi:hypothetical protein
VAECSLDLDVPARGNPTDQSIEARGGDGPQRVEVRYARSRKSFATAERDLLSFI